MSTTRITDAARSGSLYEGTKVSFAGDKLTIDKADGTDLSRTTMSLDERKALALQLVPAPAPDPVPTTGVAGDIHPFRPMQSDFDAYLTAALTDTTKQAWFKNLERARVYMGGSWPADKAYASGGTWMPRGWVYKDCMVASYTTGSAPADHYLRDKAGNKLYVKFGAMNQYAADVGNVNYRTAYFNAARPYVEKCKGLFMDDCNFEMAAVVSDVNRNFVQPWNPRTNAYMTQAEWENYMATFVEEAKLTFQAYEIAVNIVYFHSGGLANANVRRGLAAADCWEFERGYGDTGIASGTGKYGFETIQKFIDYCHSVKTCVIHDVQSTALSAEYTKGCYLLGSDGTDYIGHPNMNPATAWPTMWNTNLGKALESRRLLPDGTYERKFEKGTLKVNPSSKTSTIS